MISVCPKERWKGVIGAGIYLAGEVVYIEGDGRHRVHGE